MWIAKFRLTHDCILGNRCKKFGVTLQAVNLSTLREQNKTVNASLHYMSGKKKGIDAFVADLKRDKAVRTLERKGDTFLLVEHASSKAVGFHTPKIIFVKPVVLHANGYETWEVGSWEKGELSEFISNVKDEISDFKLLKFVRTSINNVFFPRLMPELTSNQRHALELAINEGYYTTPRKIDLRTLAKIKGVSLATFQEHLRKAEGKIIPNVLSYTV